MLRIFLVSFNSILQLTIWNSNIETVFFHDFYTAISIIFFKELKLP